MQTEQTPVIPNVTLAELAANLPVMSALAHIMIAPIADESEPIKQARIEKLRSGLQFSAILLGCVPQVAQERGEMVETIYKMPAGEGLQLLAQSLSGVNALKIHALYQAAAQGGELGQAALQVAANRGS